MQGNSLYFLRARRYRGNWSWNIGMTPGYSPWPSFLFSWLYNSFTNELNYPLLVSEHRLSFGKAKIKTWNHFIRNMPIPTSRKKRVSVCLCYWLYWLLHNSCLHIYPNSSRCYYKFQGAGINVRYIGFDCMTTQRKLRHLACHTGMKLRTKYYTGRRRMSLWGMPSQKWALLCCKKILEIFKNYVACMILWEEEIKEQFKWNVIFHFPNLYLYFPLSKFILQS